MFQMAEAKHLRSSKRMRLKPTVWLLNKTYTHRHAKRLYMRGLASTFKAPPCQAEPEVARRLYEDRCVGN